MRIAASRVLSCALREALVPVVEALLPCLRGARSFPGTAINVNFAGMRTLGTRARRRASAIGGRLDNLLETNGVITLIKGGDRMRRELLRR